VQSFFDSLECRSASHCKTCRGRKAGAGFRAAIAAYFRLATSDWDCPHGRPWELETSVEPLPLVAGQFETCRLCDNYNGSVCELRFPDGCCIDTWNRFLQEGDCPMAKPK